jgi:hypothetical protein
MNKIEIVGRLKKRVRIGRKDYYCNDVNLDKDFLIDFTNSLLIALGQCGECLPVPDPDMEPVDYYKVSKLAKVAVGEQGSLSAPWELVPPELEVYRERGHRRLAARTYDSKCSSCMWGARMPVEIIVDNWNPRGRRKYRFETFCYGPLSCKLYKAGPNRKVEGRGGMVYVEEDWVDEAAVAHRDPDE